MKVLKITAVALIWLLVFFTGSTHLDGKDSDVVKHKLSEKLYAFTGVGGNVAAFITGEGVLVVDSGKNRETGKNILAAIRGITDKPIKYLVYTHHHGDHTKGAVSFPDSTVIVSHKNTREIMLNYADHYGRYRLPADIKKLQRQLNRQITQKDPEVEKTREKLRETQESLKAYEHVKVPLAELTFEKEKTLRLGGEEIRLIYRGAGHTGGDTLVYFPGEKILHSGDLLFPKDRCFYLDPNCGGVLSGAKNYVKILDYIREMDFRAIVPGHGDIIKGKEEYDRLVALPKKYLVDLYREVKKYADQGLTLNKLRKQLKLPGYEKLRIPGFFSEHNPKVVFKEVISGPGYDVRKPFVYGETYPREKRELIETIDGYRNKAKKLVPELELLGIMVPHYIPWGYEVGAAAYKQLEGRNIKRVIILCNTHFEDFPGIAVDNHKAWETPLGKVELDGGFAEKLVNGSDIIYFDRYFHYIHAQVSNIIPFLQRAIGGEFKMVPVFLGNNIEIGEDMNDNYKVLARLLVKHMGPDDIVVVSNDMAHEFPDTKEYLAADMKTLDIIKTGDISLLDAHEKQLAKDEGLKGTILCCAIDGIKTMMELHRLLGGTKIDTLGYNRRVRDNKKFVGVGSAVFRK